MARPEHGPNDPEPASAGHDHGAGTQSPPPDEHDAHAGHGEHLAHVGPGEHTGHGGHDRHAGHGAHGEMFRRRFWISLILSVPVVAFSHMVADLLGYPMPDFPGAMWIPPVLGTVIFIYGGTPFLTGGWAELRSRRPGMMLLIGMAITVAFAASWVTTQDPRGGLRAADQHRLIQRALRMVRPERARGIGSGGARAAKVAGISAIITTRATRASTAAVPNGRSGLSDRGMATTVCPS